MKSCRSLFAASLALLALHAVPAHAVTLYPTDDTSSTLDFSVGKNPVETKSFLTNAAGTAGSLSVSKTHNAFIEFNATNALSGATVTSAKLTIYFPSVTKAGTLTLHEVTDAWTEAFKGASTATAAEPTIDSAALDSVALTPADAKQFVTFDVTSALLGWLGMPGSEHGFAFQSDGVLSCLIGAKEGPGTGYPAVLEVDVDDLSGGTVSATTATFSGSVGIGTTSPTTNLNVVGASPSIEVQDTGTSFAGLVSANTAASFFAGVDNFNSTSLYTIYENSPNNGPLLSITTNVGIGTTTPGSLLEVNGSTKLDSTLNVSGVVGLGTNTSDSRFPLTIEGNNQGSNTSTILVMETSAGKEAWHLQLDGTNGNGEAGENLDFVETGVAGDRLVLAPGGNIGIGVATPGVKLDIAAPSGFTAGARITSSDPNGAALVQVVNNTGVIGEIGVEGSTTTPSPSEFVVAALGNTNINFVTNGANRMAVTGAGDVFIGPSGSIVGLLTVQGSLTRTGLGGSEYFYSQTGPDQSTDSGTEPCSIYASEIVTGAAFEALSDARIKNIQGRSNSAADLQTLRDIEITDYHFKDVIAKGSRPQKKVIAQQVEKVYPQAVSQHTDVVPDIYQCATVQDGWVSLGTDLQVGERVKLIGEKEKEEGVYEVLEVDDGMFRTAFQPTTDKVFVYGREVKDFHTVDYEAIAMLNVSATQELAKKLEAKDAEIAQLNTKLAGLEAKDREREARLTRLENALEAQSDRPVIASLRLK